MSGLCGWFSSAAEAASDIDVTAMAAQVARFSGAAISIKAAPWGAVAATGRSTDCDVFQAGERLAALVGHARFTDKDLAGWAKSHGVASALAEGYRRAGSEVLQALTGSFALAVRDGGSGNALLAVDRTGTRPLYYATSGGELIFGSTLDALSAVPSVGHELSRQAIYEYVYFHMVPGPQTVYADCRRLLPGTFLSWDGSSARTAPYWEMLFVEDEQRPFEQLKEQFLRLIRDSVSEAAKDVKCGAFLSGGTDSSTVAGVLREVTGEAPRTYSIGFNAPGYDEMNYARIAARHFGSRHHEYYVAPDDVVSAIPRIAALHDQPFGNSSAVPTYYCARLAKEDGIETLLGGDGGDELFGGNARYAIQRVYSFYSDLPSTVRKGILEPVAFALPESVPIVGKVQRYMRNASQPMPARYDNYNLVERLGSANIFAAEFLDSIDINKPKDAMAQAYRDAHAKTLINRMLALDLKYTLADNDLPKVTRSCELAGVDVRFPMLDDAVVAFSARLAPELKLKGTNLRYFFKQALRDFLPAEIIAKKKHGFGLPFGPWLETHKPLEQLARDSLSDLRKRMIIRPGFIDELMSMHVPSHAGYFGTMVWVLMMLEGWFRQHRPAA